MSWLRQETAHNKYKDLLDLLEKEFGKGVCDYSEVWKYRWKYFAILETTWYGRVSIDLKGLYKDLQGLLTVEPDYITLFNYKCNTEGNDIYCPKKACKIIVKYITKLDKLCKTISKLDKSQIK